jgi:uncharacterized damage-inducible protein DinB
MIRILYGGSTASLGGDDMTTANPVEILLAHDRWATQQILDACAGLAEEQFHRRFDIGPGSLHDTTTHLLGAMRRWTDMLAGREQRARLEGTKRSPVQLKELLDEITSDFATIAKKHPVEEIVTGTAYERTFTLPRSAVITHVATHGMHHRAQCLNMLRQLGVQPLPPSSVMEWVRATAS